MKLHFEDDLDYQKAAIDSVVSLFKGQEISRSEFTVTFQPESGPNLSLGMEESQLGIGNRLRLLDEEIVINLRKEQLQNGLQLTEDLVSGDFTVEMETGTGKTYVYLRTIFEELFAQEELKGYLKNSLKVQQSVYTHVVYDSGVEKSFAEDLEKNKKVKVYAKLPAWFKVPTPLGSYNPDWAVVVENNGEEKLYFVVETKGSTWTDELRHLEAEKIKCGNKHFDELAKVTGNPARYIKAADIDGMMRYVD